MDKRVHSLDINAKNVGKKVVIGGWVHELRSFGKLKFAVLKDRFGFFQITLPKTMVSEESFNLFDSLTKEACVLVEGKVQEAKQVASGAEIIPSKFEILGPALTPTPIDTSGKIDSDLSVRLDYRFLDLRDPKKLALFKIRSKMVRATAEFFDGQGFTCIQTPKLTQAGVESGATLFPVDYFGQKGYLSQSPQIYKQMMVISGFEKVYEIGPVFRAEKSQTSRHLTEFTGIDFEMGFIKSEDEVMDVIEEYIKHLIKTIKAECKEELKLFGVDPKVPKKIPRIPMAEVKALLAKQGKKLPAEEDLDPEAERMAGAHVLKNYGEEFVFVTNFPWKVRPFYHMKPEGEPNGTKSFDLLWNGLEVATGAQREHRYDILKAQATEKGVDLDGMKDYSLLFQYGPVPHGGVGLGLDRFMESLLKLDNIREGILLPRDPMRLNP